MRWGWVALVPIVLLVACAQTSTDTPSGAATAEQVEITERDVVPLLFNESLNSTQVTVRGVQLGDSKQNVTAALGAPYNFTRFDDVLNYYYRGGNGTALIVHMENETVTRITLQQPFNEQLHGKTVINETKSGIYRDLGLPDSKDIAFKYIIFEYEKEGVEIITFRGDEFGFSLLPPDKVSESIREPRYQKRIPFGGEVQLQ